MFRPRLRFQRSLLVSKIVSVHSKTCPARKDDDCSGSKSSKAPQEPTCEDGGDDGVSSVMLPDFKRAEKSAPVRCGFLPDEWFRFFYPQTGVTGPYVFGIVLINYWLSKEIYVMEHEYYLGLSVALMTYYVTTRFGPSIAKSLDEEVDAIVAEMEKGRQDERDYYLGKIKEAEDAKKRANGQKVLMDAKKENIAMQLEAVFRERMMLVYRTTKGRLDYQIRRYMVLTKVHQRWMIEWILESVRRAITPEFEQQALDSAIKDLATAAEKR